MEQPEGAVRRILRSDVGIDYDIRLNLEDAMTYIDADDRSIQYIIIVYRVLIDKEKRAVKLSSHYDKYLWYKAGKVDQSALTDASQLILGMTLEDASQGDISSNISDARQRITVYVDGGSRGNPGHSAAGYVIVDGGVVVDQGGEYIGVTTNNQAEYHGVKLGLEAAVRLGVRNLEMRIDSMLVVNQLKGIYKIKNRELWPIHERIQELTSQLDKVSFTHVPREMNRLADGVVNRVLDERKSVV